MASKFKPIFESLSEAAVRGARHADTRLPQLTTNHSDQIDLFKGKIDGLDRYDDPGSNGSGNNDSNGGPGDPVHGQQVPNPAGDGPVIFRVPEGATPEEVAQFHDYVNRSNQYLSDGSLSDSGRVSTAGDIAREARREARLERNRASEAGTPYEGVVAHVPDSTWVGQGRPPGWGDYTSNVNSSLAGQVNRYPVGYNPTIFIVRER